MALEYTATLGGEVQPEEVLDWFSSVAGLKRDKEKIIAADMEILIYETVGLASLVIEDEFDFPPSLSISFRLNKFGDPVSMRKQIVRAVSALLQNTYEDAVLLFNGQTVILQRINGRLALNHVEGFWVDEVKELITGSYKFEDIASI